MRANAFVSLLILCGLLAASAAVRPGAADQNQSQIQQIVHTIESRYHSSNTLKAAFLERYNEGHPSDRSESGTVYFSRPGRMRWEYEVPEQKLFLTDGKTAWFYVPADHTVTRAPMKESSDWRTPLALLTGKADLDRYCRKIELSSATPENSGDVTLRCLPAGAEGAARGPGGESKAEDDGARQALSLDQNGKIQEVLLEADPKTGWLAKVSIRQPGGIEMEYHFGKWEGNPALPEAMFHFTAPKGVAIVGESAAGNTSH
jgi:outer membrane lipoprotein carrier protein